jgi:hypothetical protein
VPGPCTLSGRLVPGEVYSDRYAVAEALIPRARRARSPGCGRLSEITVDRPSMSCYTWREGTEPLRRHLQSHGGAGLREMPPIHSSLPRKL